MRIRAPVRGGSVVSSVVTPHRVRRLPVAVVAWVVPPGILPRRPSRSVQEIGLVQFRPLTSVDETFLRRMIYLAWRWDRVWDEAEYLAYESPPHPDNYVRAFGQRAGDIGVGAEDGGRLVGAAWCRVLTATNAGTGYVDDETPELAMAVEAPYRGRGVGRALLGGLIEGVRAAGYSMLSLHVAVDNRRARSLYDRLGFQAIKQGDSGMVMVLPLDAEDAGQGRAAPAHRPRPRGR